MTDPYFKVHHELRRLRGPASDYMCSCGEPARDWAYQHTGENLRGEGSHRSYSPDLDDYIPMCQTCHRRYDYENDPEFREKMDRNRGAGGRAFSARLKSDPEFAKRVSEANREKGKKSSGGKAFAAKMKSDSEFAQRMTESNRENGRRVSKMKRKCLECGKISSPAGLGAHRRATGHDGWVDC